MSSAVRPNSGCLLWKSATKDVKSLEAVWTISVTATQKYYLRHSTLLSGQLFLPETGHSFFFPVIQLSISLEDTVLHIFKRQTNPSFVLHHLMNVETRRESQRSKNLTAAEYSRNLLRYFLRRYHPLFPLASDKHNDYLMKCIRHEILNKVEFTSSFEITQRFFDFMNTVAC